LIRYYPIVLIGGIVLIFWSWPRVTYLFKNISTDPIDLLPPTYQSVNTLFKLRDKIDQKRRFDILFESENPDNTKRLMADVKTYLEGLPGVGRVYIKKPGYTFLDKNKFLFIDQVDLIDIKNRIDRKIQREKLGSLYISFEEDDEDSELEFSDIEEKYRDKYGGGGEGVSSEYYVSPNEKIFALFVESEKSNIDIAEEKVFIESVHKAMEGFDYKSYDPTMTIQFGGSTRVREYSQLLKDLKVAGIITGFIIFLPILIRFRRPQYFALIFLPLLIGVPTGLAITSLWIPRLNITTSFLFAILGGLGVETGIHIFSRYYEKRKEGLSIEKSLLDIYLFLGKPVFTAVATLATTFLLMVVSDFRGFSEFGLITGVGLWVVFLLYFTFFPALLIFSEKIHLLKFKYNYQESQKNLNLTPSFVKTLLGIFLAFTVFSIFVTPKINFEYDMRKIRADSGHKSGIRVKQKATRGGRVNIPAAVIIQNEEEALALEESFEEIKEESPSHVLDYSTSLYSLVPKKQEEKMVTIKEIQDLLADDSIKLVKDEKKADLDKFKDELKRPSPFTLADIPEDIKKRFYGEKDIPGSLFLIFAKPQLELDDGRNGMALLDAIGEIKTPLGVYYPSSSSIVFAEVIKTMFRDSKKILIIAVCCTLFFVYLDFRNLKKTGLVMFSILSGVFWVMGVMYLLDIKFNLYNMVMIPAVMGMSVDNSIHVYHRYSELGKGSLSKVLSTTGIAAALASLTNASGFVGLAFCNHGGLRSMGIVAVIGVITCLITTLVFLPLILQFLEWRSDRVPVRHSELPIL